MFIYSSRLKLSLYIKAVSSVRGEACVYWLISSHTRNRGATVRVLDHCDDVIMGAMACQITSLTIVYSTVYSDADQGKHQSSASLAFVWEPGTGEFPAQMASDAENVSIWWRHHDRKEHMIQNYFVCPLHHLNAIIKCRGYHYVASICENMLNRWKVTQGHIRVSN